MSEANAPAAARMHDPEEPHGTSVPMPHHKVNYLFIFFSLVILTIATVLVAFHRFENEVANLLLALLIASIKATLVAMFFMHLKFEGKLIYIIAIVPLMLCVLLVCALIPDIMYGHLMNDVGHTFMSTFGMGENPHH